MLSDQYWNKRYLDGETQWDAGSPTLPLKEYIDQLDDTSIRVLIPGAGNAHEAQYLHEKGFQDVCVLDWAEQPLKQFSERVPDFPSENLLHSDFFDLSGQFDLILEQTFFCAIEPKYRTKYVNQCADLLASDGQIVGVLFDHELDATGDPPFGGSEEEYRGLFADRFDIQVLERCRNSIKPRMDRELFAILRRK